MNTINYIQTQADKIGSQYNILKNRYKISPIKSGIEINACANSS